jgi:hypothetical protein
MQQLMREYDSRYGALPDREDPRFLAKGIGRVPDS